MHPALELWPPSIKKYFTNPKPLNCNSEKNWVSVHLGRLFISTDAVHAHGDIACSYTQIFRGMDDDEAHFGTNITFKDGDLLTSDSFKVYCSAKDGTSYTNLHNSVMFKPKLWKHDDKQHLNEAALGLDVLIFGFDSMSHLMWLRNLPKTHAYFTQELGGLVFEQYNVVGYNTRKALLAMLTGHKLSELPEVRRGVPGAQYVDDLPWLFQEFKRAGYVTQWGEDNYPATFNQVLRGFQRQPVDHYLRPFYIKLPKTSFTNMQSTFCLGSEPRHRVMTQSILDLYSVYDTKPKFIFMFNSEYTHDSPNMVRLFDDDFSSFLRTMTQRNWLNNTLLILMSDHGPRLPHLLPTPQRRYEQRLPFLGIRFPKWFEQIYPMASRNLRKNRIRLATPFDVHATLIETLIYNEHLVHPSKSRSLSLLHEVPIKRTCADAGIDPEWCACLRWREIPTDYHIVQKAIRKLIAMVNSYTVVVRQKCHIWSAVRIISARKYQGYWDTLQDDPLAPKLNHGQLELYQIEITVAPNDALFETVVKVDIESERMFINLDEISRLNKHGHQSTCLEHSHPYLREFCQCKC